VAPSDLPFAIDPHPFRDADGQWYLFYARDFLDTKRGVRAGTALMADRLPHPDRVAGHPTVILRARHDWQRFQESRPMYGGVHDWHTLEGPCVTLHRGKYYCFYSGGRWENATYGVDYAVADHVLGPYSDAGNGTGARVLHTSPGIRIGPGHNSIVSDAEGRDYLAFHAWDPGMNARRLFVERLYWTAEGPRAESTRALAVR
jgi:beta-xylosidase